MADQTLVLGLDVGGTTSRAVLATREGRRHGAGRSTGGNPVVLDAESAAAAVGEAVAQALAGADPGRLAAVTVGLAGGGKLASVPEAAEAFGRMWEQAGVRCPVSYAPDALVAFAAGTPEPDGSLLLSGTGAIAAAVRDGSLAAHGDGHGWLLGDRGSGFWLGRRAVIAALAELEGPGPATALTPLVLAALFGEDAHEASEPLGRTAPSGTGSHESPGPHGRTTPSPQSDTGAHPAAGSRTTRIPEPRGPVRRIVLDIVLAVAARNPARLAELAPTVTAACAAGDPVARRIADRAAEHLLTTLSWIRGPGETTPIVLSGSVLVRDTPVAAAVRRGVAERWPGAPLSQAVDGAAGAAWLAIRGLPGGPAPGTYARLLSTSTANEQNLRLCRAPEHTARERTTPPSAGSVRYPHLVDQETPCHSLGYPPT